MNACCHVITGAANEVAKDVLHKLYAGSEYCLQDSTVRALIDLKKGTHVGEITDALDKVVKIFNKYRRSYKISPKKELRFRELRLYKHGKGNIRGVFSKIYQLLQVEDSTICVIIGLDDHWAVIEKAYKDKWRVRDSAGSRKRTVYRRDCIANEDGVSADAWVIGYH